MGTGFSPAERAVLRRLRRPEDVQRFLDDEVGYNLEHEGDTLRSPRRVLRERVGHCFEGALLAASALRFHGHRPLLLLLTAERDDDHVLALFRETRAGGAWGAIAKSKYLGLRFREPVYRTLRELAMSYFDHYYNFDDEKTLRKVSRPLDLTRFDRISWETAEEDLWDVNDAIASLPLTPLVSPAQVRRLRLMDRHTSDGSFLVALAGMKKPKPQRRRAAR